jgi:hypothetical protein
MAGEEAVEAPEAALAAEAPAVEEKPPPGSGSEEEEEPEPEPTPEEKGEWLLNAAKSGDEAETARLVLDAEAEEFLQFTDNRGWTPLLWAACNGHTDCVASLVEHGAASVLVSAPAVEEDDEAKPAPKSDSSPVRPRHAPLPTVVNSPLHWASFKGHLHIVFKLLLHGVPLDDCDEQGNTGLHLASAGGDVPTVLCHLNHGANLFGKNFFCNTPMDLGTKPAIKKVLSVLCVEKTFEMSDEGKKSARDKADAHKSDDAMHWNGLSIRQVAYPTTRILCTGIWCRESNATGAGVPGNGMGRFFSTDACKKQDVLDRIPAGDTLPPAFLCGVCMEQVNDAEMQCRHGMENRAKETMGDQITTMENAIEHAKRMGASAALIEETIIVLHRVRAEKALTDHMDAVEEARPITQDEPIATLKALLQEAERQIADRELVTNAHTLLHSAEAEFALANALKPFEGLELAVEMAVRHDINRMKSAMATAQRDAGHAGQLEVARKLLKRLTVETKIGQAIAMPKYMIGLSDVMVGKKKKARVVQEPKITGYIHATLDAAADKEGEKYGATDGCEDMTSFDKKRTEEALAEFTERKEISEMIGEKRGGKAWGKPIDDEGPAPLEPIPLGDTVLEEGGQDWLLDSLYRRVSLIEEGQKEVTEGAEKGDMDPVNADLLTRAAERLEVLKVELQAEIEVDEERKRVEAIAKAKAEAKAAKAAKKKKK